MMNSRRQFLKQFLSGTSIALGQSSLSFAGLEETSPAKVIIVGAGLSGLIAAYELQKRGHHVSIIEARNRPGGRVLTLRDQFAGNLYADAGAARIHASHDLTLKYVKQFNLGLEPFYAASLDYLIHTDQSIITSNPESFSQSVRNLRGKRLGNLEEWFKIPGGNDRLPRALAKTMHHQIRYGCPVEAITQENSRASVTFKCGSTSQNEQADYVICTVPYSVINAIHFEPELSPNQQKLIRQMRNYDSATRTFSQFRSRFWTDHGLNGFAVTDDAEIWPSTFLQPGSRGIMQVYTWQKVSKRITSMAPEQRDSQSFQLIQRLFPSSRDHFEFGMHKCWELDAWALGGWSSKRNINLKIAIKPEGRIIFAGVSLFRTPIGPT